MNYQKKVFILVVFFRFVFYQKIKHKIRCIKILSENCTQKHDTLVMKPNVVTDSSQSSPPTQRCYRSRGNNILVGTFVKVKVDEFEDEVRESFPRCLRKEVAGVMEALSIKIRFLVRF